jgi:SOS-response transcriptional repressor LexA
MELLRFVSGYQLAHHGISPSFQECADALQTSKSRIAHLFDDLECRGHARRLNSRARAMHVLRPVTVPMIGDQPLYAVRGPWSAQS